MEAHMKALFNHQILEEAGKHFDVELKDLFKVGGFENFIYGYKKSEEEFILRISHSSHRTYEELLAELDFVNYLAVHHANVSIPIVSKEKNLVEKIDIKNSYFTVSSYIKAKGERPTPEYFNENFFFNYGRTIGNFHRLAKKYHPRNSTIKRFKWDGDPLFINARSYLLDTDEIIYNRFTELIKKLNQLPITKENYGLIHTDIHIGNFFTKDDQLCVFDFDDCAYMWFISDIAIALFYYLDFSMRDETHEKENAHFFMTHFMKGYLTENKLSYEDMSMMQDFLKLRELVLYIVLYRSVDMEQNNFAKRYVDKYRNRIIHHVPFVELDFTQYL
ncbi:MAG: phosphotransferase [Bacillota bacterium]